jgi:hypothetical protein
VVQKFKADRVKTRILPENGLVQSGLPDRRACDRSKWAKIPQKPGMAFHSAPVFTRSGPKAALAADPAIFANIKTTRVDGENDSVVQGAHG